MKRILALALALLILIGSAAAEQRWVMCDGYVNVRISPGKKAEQVGYLDAGDGFETNGKKRDGFIQVTGIGEAGDGWTFEGYTVTEQPDRVDQRYVCVAKNRVACRRWINGPRIKGKAGWLYNGTSVMVYWRTSEWSVTSRGYIRSEWLEVDTR